MHKYFAVAIVGRPNVGKSTLFNRMVGFRKAVTSKEPGTTRDRVIADVDWKDKTFTLIDTAGVLFDFYGFKDEEIEQLSQKQIEESLSDADLILATVSYKDGLTAKDAEIVDKIRSLGKEVILVCNKADNLVEEQSCGNFLSLGISEIFPVSARAGRRVASLMDRIYSSVNTTRISEGENKRMAIIGRPNVGKSTLFNNLVGEDKAIVSDVAGTTRDSINEVVKLINSSVEVIDTAGLRRRGRREVGVEKFSVFRTLDAIYEADLVLLIVDAEEGVTRGDAHLAQLAIDKDKKVLLVINKIDKLQKKYTTEVKNLYRYKFMTKLKSIAISAKDCENLDILKKEIEKEI